jgi:cephalosporin-C deacetylase-like acetyl esterase
MTIEKRITMTIQSYEMISPVLYYYDLRDQLKRHVYERSEQAFAVGDAVRDSIKTTKDLLKRQAFVRKAFIEAIGRLPENSSSLNSKITGTIQEKEFRIEKVIFESRPGAYVTANLYIPDDRTLPGGSVLFLCGHGYEAKGFPQYQTECRTLVKAGLVVLIMDPLGQGERMGYYEPALKRTTVRWGSYEHDFVGSQCLPLGDSLARYFLHDAIRGFDYLCSRSEIVDPSRIGVTGSSGGGTQTCMMMICDQRIAAAVPGKFVTSRHTYMMAGGVQDCEQIWPGVTAAGIDHEDFLLMMAPKPVRVQAVKYDYFPIEGTRRTVERCRRFWELYKKTEHLDMVEDASIHDCGSTVLNRSEAEFFAKHLLGTHFHMSEEGTAPIDPSILWCTKSGQVRSELPKVRFVFEENQSRLKLIQKELKKVPKNQLKKKGLAWLKKTVFAHRQPCDLNLRLYAGDTSNALILQAGFWWSQIGIFNHAFIFRDYRFNEKTLPLTLAVWDHGTQRLKAHESWIHQTCQSGRAVMVLDVTGVGAIKPNLINYAIPEDRDGTIRKMNDDLILLGDSLAAIRVYDVLRALDVIKFWPGLDTGDVQFYAHGLQGIYAQLAARLDDRVRKIEVTDGIRSIAEWVASRHYDMSGTFDLAIPGMLNHLDLTDLK